MAVSPQPLRGATREKDNDSESGRSRKSVSSGTTASLFSFDAFEVPSCSFNPNTARGRRIFVVQMLVLPFVPILALVIQNTYTISAAVQHESVMVQLKQTIDETADIGELLMAMQRERFEVAFYIFTGSNSRHQGAKNMMAADYRNVSTMSEAYNSSNAALESASCWNIIRKVAKYRKRMFFSKIRFQTRLEDLRELVLADPVEAQQRIEWYDRVTIVLLDAVTRRVTASRRGISSDQIRREDARQSTMLAYINMMRVMENLSLLLSLVPRYLAEGSLSSRHLSQATRCDTLFSVHINNTRLFAGMTASSVQFGEDLAFVNSVRDAMLLSEPASELNVTTAQYHRVARSLLGQLEQLHLLMRLNVDTDTGRQVRSAHLRLLAALGVMIMVLLLAPALIMVARTASIAMERFTETLAEKTVEVRREVRKADRLLYQMLPKQVALQLKRRHQVPAELFHSVTVYFSDIVDFDMITSRSTPIQVVTFLNMLYQLFDGRIDRYDIYKMETIGETYMCVSGLPKPNGDRHATEIADMALDILTVAHQFRVPHIPDKFVEIRSGINSGPCVAGCVGTTRPRYCLFGDTVNVASRMETTGDPMKIQISHTTRELLEKAGGYHVEFRADTTVKGKGKMATYWLMGKEGAVQRNVDISVPGFMAEQPEFMSPAYLYHAEEHRCS